MMLQTGKYQIGLKTERGATAYLMVASGISSK